MNHVLQSCASSHTEECPKFSVIYDIYKCLTADIAPVPPEKQQYDYYSLSWKSNLFFWLVLCESVFIYFVIVLPFLRSNANMEHVRLVIHRCCKPVATTNMPL